MPSCLGELQWYLWGNGRLLSNVWGKWHLTCRGNDNYPLKQFCRGIEPHPWCSVVVVLVDEGGERFPTLRKKGGKGGSSDTFPKTHPYSPIHTPLLFLASTQGRKEGRRDLRRGTLWDITNSRAEKRKWSCIIPPQFFPEFLKVFYSPLYGRTWSGIIRPNMQKAPPYFADMGTDGRTDVGSSIRKLFSPSWSLFANPSGSYIPFSLCESPTWSRSGKANQAGWRSPSNFPLSCETRPLLPFSPAGAGEGGGEKANFDSAESFVAKSKGDFRLLLCSQDIFCFFCTKGQGK